MSWLDKNGYMHQGSAPPGTDVYSGGAPPTDIDEYGRKLIPGETPEQRRARDDVMRSMGQGNDGMRPVHGPNGQPVPVGAPPPPPSAPGGQSMNVPMYGGLPDPDGKIRAHAEGLPDPVPDEQILNNHFEYGGRPGGAEEAAGRYKGLAEQAQGRRGELIDTGRSHSMANQAQNHARGQDLVAGLMWNRANGNTPSIAGMQADRQMRQAAAEQSSAAASARGPAGLALAQQGAAANTAAMQSNISNTAQINAAQERQAAEIAAMGAFTGMRGQDFQGQGLEQDMAQKQASLNAAQRAQNDAYSTGLYGNEISVNSTQLGAQGNKIAIASGQQIAQNNLDHAKNESSKADYWKIAGMTLGGLGTAAAVTAPWWLPSGHGGNGSGSSAGQGDPLKPSGQDGGPLPPGEGYYDQNGQYIHRADGGPVNAGQPYMVGERGPELVIPQQNGLVISNEDLRERKLRAQQAQGQMSDGLMSQAPTIGSEYLNYVRGQ